MEQNTVSYQSPLGSWNRLNPTFNSQLRALLKKTFIIKCRTTSAIVEIVVAFFIPILGLMGYTAGGFNFENTPSPAMNPVNNQDMMNWFLTYGKESQVICMPDKPRMHYLIENTTDLKTIINGGNINGTSMPGTDFKYVNSIKEIKQYANSNDKNNVGIEWANIDSPDSLTSPSINVYIRSQNGYPQLGLYYQLRDSLIKMRFSNKKNQSKIDQMEFMNVSFYSSEFAHPLITQRMTDLGFSNAMLSSIAIILLLMSDIELIFIEKGSKITALSFLMGMGEVVYWFCNFIVSFIFLFVFFIYVSCLYSFVFGLKGCNFGVIFVFTILFSIAEIWFEFFLTTLINNAQRGKSLPVILIMVGIILSFFFQFVTLKEKSTASMALNNIFCLYPMSAFEIFIIQGYIANVADLPLYKWNNMHDKAYVCPPWIPYMWAVIDIVIYFVLFVVCNAYAPRAFGVSQIKLKEFFRRNKNEDTSQIDESQNKAIDVLRLLKIYKGARNVVALNKVSFDIKKGEVIVLIGPNGAGKSTLINCISGGIKHTDGSIQILGQVKVTRLGVCYQDNVLIPKLSVDEHFKLFGAFRGVSKEVLESSTSYFCSTMQLSHILKNRAGDLSGGQKRKLCIALSLFGNPYVVLMDEPTAGVDVQACQLIWKMIATLKNTTFLITSHALEEAETVSSRLFILSNGDIKFTGTSTELREEFKCGYELRVERSDGRAAPILPFVQKFIPEAKVADDRADVILIPITDSIGQFLLEFRKEQQNLGVISYSFSVQQLEDMLLKSLGNNDNQ